MSILHENMKSSKSQSIDNIISSVTYYYHDFWEIEADPRTSIYPLMKGGPWKVISLVALYIYFVKFLGPNIMKTRPAFDLRRPIFIYNVMMVLLNGWFVYEGSIITNFGLGCWGCKLADKSTSEETKKIVFLGYCFFISKLVEFADTVFFVLRKKDSQVSPLHVIHHSLVPLLIWFGCKISPGGDMALFPYLNSIIHTLMYFYYGMASLGPRYRPYLWWKKYLTTLQMLQFVVVIIHSLRALVIPKCPVPIVLIYLSIFNGLMFFSMFYAFYRDSYKPDNIENKTK